MARQSNDQTLTSLARQLPNVAKSPIGKAGIWALLAAFACLVAGGLSFGAHLPALGIMSAVLTGMSLLALLSIGLAAAVMFVLRPVRRSNAETGQPAQPDASVTRTSRQVLGWRLTSGTFVQDVRRCAGHAGVMSESVPMANHAPDDPNLRDRFVRLDDGVLHVMTHGHSEAPAMLLVSNAAAPTAIWDPVVPLLAETFRVIRVDLLGHGTPASTAGRYDVPSQARCLAAVLDGLAVRRVTAIGHSSGCMLATALAEQRPDAVVSLTLIDMGPDMDAKLPDGLLFPLLMAPLTGRLLWRLRNDQAIRKAARSGMARQVDIPDAFVEHGQMLKLQDVVGTMRGAKDYLQQRSLPDRLVPLGLPLLVVFGADDGRWRSESAAAYRVVPGARIELLPGVGHTPMMEDPDATGPLLRDFAQAAARPR